MHARACIVEWRVLNIKQPLSHTHTLCTHPVILRGERDEGNLDDNLVISSEILPLMLHFDLVLLKGSLLIGPELTASAPVHPARGPL